MDCKLRAKNCGGCPMLATEYAAQLKKKEADVRALLGKYGPVAPIRGMETPYHYRNKVISTFAPAAGGKLTSGIYAARTHKVLPVESCLLQDEVLDKVMLAVRAAANACRYQPFNEDKGTGLLRHCLLRRGVATGQVMVVLVTAQPVLPGAKNFVKALLAEAEKRGVPVTTVVQNYNPRRTSVVLGEDEKVLYGKGFILDTLCGKTYALSPRSFYQVNPVQTAVLYGLAVDAAHLTGKEVVLDAYCGIGTIGLTASDKARQVVGVEVNRDAVRDAIGNAKHNGVKNARFFAADATAWIREAADAGQKADVVFMDPPREGSTPAFIESVARMAPKRVVYVSCNPETMARDLALLTQKGYRAEGFTPVDMFPHSTHCETVCALSKLDIYQKITVDLKMDELDVTAAETKATYEEIREYVKEHTGLNVSDLYIAQVKHKCGIKERQNYNKPKAENPKQLKCPAEKERAIREALKYFKIDCRICLYRPATFCPAIIRPGRAAPGDAPLGVSASRHILNFSCRLHLAGNDVTALLDVIVQLTPLPVVRGQFLHLFPPVKTVQRHQPVEHPLSQDGISHELIPAQVILKRFLCEVGARHTGRVLGTLEVSNRCIHIAHCSDLPLS